MAFFGLTALGSQSHFGSLRSDAYTVALFEIDEFSQAYDAISAQDGGVGAAQIEKILRKVFHGPPPAPELDRVLRHFGVFDFGCDATGIMASTAAAHINVGVAVDKEAFLAGIAELQSYTGSSTASKASDAAHYTSFDMLRTAKVREVRAEHGPEELFIKPVTGAQSYGWTVKEALKSPDKRHPKVHCDETKFVAELIKFGVIF